MLYYVYYVYYTHWFYHSTIAMYVCTPVASRDSTHDGKSETCENTSLDHKFV